jgi:di/tricarboxylate transporter
VPTPAVVTLIAVAAALVLSCTSRLNVGLIAIALAWLIGTFVAGWSADTIAAGFPTQLFLTLAGVTLLFAASEVNGTVSLVARRVMRLARGNVTLVPLLFFLVAMAISTVGPGAVASVALVIPIAMVLGAQAGVAPLLTALMVSNGANAGNLSPLSAVGIIANQKMVEAGVGGHEWKVWASNFFAHLAVAMVAWALFGRHRGEARSVPTMAVAKSPSPDLEPLSFDRRQVLTAAVVASWIAGVVVLRLHVGFSAFVAAVLLLVAGAADETDAVKRMPWSAILMVSGVSVLITVLEKTGGMELLTGLMARFATPGTLNGFIAFLTGTISTYSSTSGVVLPTFLPTVPGLVERVGGGDPLAVSLSINVGSSLVDVSPLSTIGALCVAAAMDPVAGRDLFRKMLIWGISMVIVGAVLCQLLAGPFARL